MRGSIVNFLTWPRWSSLPELIQCAMCRWHFSNSHAPASERTSYGSLSSSASTFAAMLRRRMRLRTAPYQLVVLMYQKQM